MLPDTQRNKLIFLIVISLIAMLGACGGGSSGSSSNETGAGSNSGGENSGNTNGAAGRFDLSSYQFHANVFTNGERVDFTEKLYGQGETADGTLLVLNRSFVGNNGVIEEYDGTDLIKRFTVGATTITEEIIKASERRVYNRFADIGDTYMDADSVTPSIGGQPGLAQNATCVLKEKLASFDLSTVGDGTPLATGVYQDVVRVECVTAFVSQGQVAPHTTLTHYMAKDIGMIYSEGSVLLFGDVLIVDEY